MQIVPIGGLAATNTPGDILRTYSLGSCVAVIFVCPGLGAAAMAHVALPFSGFNPGAGAHQPGYYADLAVPAMLKAIAGKGCLNTRSGGLAVKLAGGASLNDPRNYFRVGSRNLKAIRAMLAHYGLVCVAEDVGGENLSRTVEVVADTGVVTVIRTGVAEKKCLQL